MFTLNCKGKLLVASNPLVMGIINTTPDSFYAGSRRESIEAVVQQAGRMLRGGADILDIGGQSTRPGSEPVTATVEKARVTGAIDAIMQAFPNAVISIDTFYAEVATAAVAAGASIVNDVSAGEIDNNMLPAVAAMRVPYVCMHMKGHPQTMQSNPVYKDIVKELLDYFNDKIAACRKAGINDIIIDPGFGFGKTITHNFILLKQLASFTITGKPLLAGLSRKSTVYKTLGTTAEEALNGTTVLNTIALQNGAEILRVHDVKEAVETVRLFTAYKNANS
jgi:dihydropteroate synthase